MQPTRARVVVQDVGPSVRGGRFPAKVSVAEHVRIHADVVADGHDLLRVVARVTHADGSAVEVELAHVVNDRWEGRVAIGEVVGPAQLAVGGWIDHLGTWARDLATRRDAGQVEDVHLRTGAALLRDHAKEADASDARLLEEAAATLDDDTVDLEERTTRALDDQLLAAARRSDPRRHVGWFAQDRPLWVDRERARFSSWYELFPRSASPDPDRPGTLRDVIDHHVERVAGLGFDVLYLPPIHPIGVSHRKGPDNVERAGPDDPGSPWAIGSSDGGHTTVAPELGDLDDVDDLVAACRDHGIELALDIAFQCSPDHPWTRSHPQWFRQRPDGTIRYAENPPKRYQDIYPLDFETADVEGLWTALEEVFEFWMGRGVRVFRVDNPHTKSMRFWEWCSSRLLEQDPGIVLLSEAFTRPKVMRELAERGFTQSYTYFAWRQEKWELEEYYTELHRTDLTWSLRPNSWPNTPDILTEQLAAGGRAVHLQRLVLAATLTASYGIYGPPYERVEAVQRPGAEEYANNEKYAVRHWDLDAPGGIAGQIGQVNSIRHAHPALQQDRDFTFHHVDNDALVAYSKRDVGSGDVVLVVVSLDPVWTQGGFTWLDLEALDVADEPFEVHDLLGGGTFTWQGPRNYVELGPAPWPAHVLEVRR